MHKKEQRKININSNRISSVHSLGFRLVVCFERTLTLALYGIHQRHHHHHLLYSCRQNKFNNINI